MPSGDIAWPLKLLGIVLIGILLWYGKPVLLPLAIAALLAFLLTPLCEWLEHRKLPRVVATGLVMILVVVVLGGIGFTLWSGVEQIGRKQTIEAYSQRLQNKVGGLIGSQAGDDAEAGVTDAIGNIGKTISKVSEVASGGDDEPEEAVLEETFEEVDDERQEPTTQPTEAVDSGTDLLARVADRFDQSLQTREEAIVTAIGAAAERLENFLIDFRRSLADSDRSPVRIIETPRQETALQRAGNLLVIAAGPAGTAGLVAVFLLFILLQRDDLRDRIIKLAAGRRINLATQALDDASRRISRYLRAQATVNGTYGLTIGLGLAGISYGFTGESFPGLFLWATLCAILRFIPYLGPWLAAAFPLFVSLGHYDGYNVFLAVAAMFIVVELISNNVMEPVLYGSAVGMSDFAVIVAATVWTFLWGPVGLLVATPITTCLVVLGKHVPALRPIDTLLGNEPVLSPHSKLYQRLLAMDADDAAEEVEAFRKDHTLTETFDVLLLPMLRLSERDREAGNLTQERADFIAKTVREFVDELADQEEPEPADSVDLNDPDLPVPKKPAVASNEAILVSILPANDVADESAGLMLSALLRRRGYATRVLDDETLASEKLDSVRNDGTAVVVISAVPPKAASRARYLVKKLDACSDVGNSESQTIVGIWDRDVDLAVTKARVCGRGDVASRVRVVKTLETAVEEVRQRAEVVVAARRESNS
jgi:predicted PurR-regulated permease PerM